MSQHDFYQFLLHWGYLAVALAVIIEGEIFLIIVGITTATTLFNYPLVILAATAGAIFHDNSVFIFSKLTGRKFIEKRPHWQKKVDRSLRIIDKYDSWAILSVRFLYGLRTITILIIGLGNVKKLKFVVLDAISSLIWSTIYITLGYFFGHAILKLVDHDDIIHWVRDNKGLTIFIVLLLSSIIYISYRIFKNYLKRHK
ncbi:DedA family protein [Francisella adeliensis]|uniref:DedA family protein n=1 Tax=Francisella adeliensis TaxID=2007306 RepID=A0A2Z4XZ27_9GAMM|nr:DedA family protein [Francisella adeliensis]AXA34111.1 DedA family protein [Francisella adeliensis]MBK2085279.1 DedA family protein [Francisella adeliensis]MBK2095953.1 DedA family protein [Francisella adeliensis]QIW12353.1 DedA family protein [Francisella adeliensis]QIW14227.1 DedA family protein [Francisella adeliensis]